MRQELHQPLPILKLGRRGQLPGHVPQPADGAEVVASGVEDRLRVDLHVDRLTVRPKHAHQHRRPLARSESALQLVAAGVRNEGRRRHAAAAEQLSCGWIGAADAAVTLEYDEGARSSVDDEVDALSQVT